MDIESIKQLIKNGDFPQAHDQLPWIKYAAMFAMIFTFGLQTCYAQVTHGDDVTEEVAPMRTNVEKGKRVVVINKFENKSNATDRVLEMIHARVQQYVAGSRKFEVEDSERLKAASYIISGKVLHFGIDKSGGNVGGVLVSVAKSKIELQVKITNGETGKVLIQKSAVGHGVDRIMVTSDFRSATDQGVRDAIDEACHMVADALRDVAYPAKVIKIGQKDITINMTDEEVKEGDVFDLIEADKPVADPDTGVSLGYDGDYVGSVVITRTGLHTSKANPIGGLNLNGLDIGKHTYILRRVRKETFNRRKPKT